VRHLYVDNLYFAYGENSVLNGVSFTVEQGKLVGILGENGCGKTTLLKCLAGILPDNNACAMDDITLSSLRPKERATLMAYVPQVSGISLDMTAGEVVLMGFYSSLSFLQSPDRRQIGAAKKALATVGLPDAFDKSYLELSRGQQQVCILARTLVQDVMIYLLDEPESAMDFQHRFRLLSLVKARIRDMNVPSCGVVSLHDPLLALNLCDELLLLQDGRILGKCAPKQDDLENISALLSRIYGKVRVLSCPREGGEDYLTLVPEVDF